MGTVNGILNNTAADIITGAGSIVTVPVINTNVVVDTNLNLPSPLYPPAASAWFAPFEE